MCSVTYIPLANGFILTSSRDELVFRTTVLQVPDKPALLLYKVQWLSGEGAGSWFHIEKYNDLFKVFRHNPEGEIECSGLFTNLSNEIRHLNKSYEFIHLSHCNQVAINQVGKIIQLTKTDTIIK